MLLELNSDTVTYRRGKMSILFSKNNNSSRIREPLFQITRVKYRGARSSSAENLETNLIKLDITRIYNELENIDLSILDKLEIFVSGNSSINDSIRLQDGITNNVDGIDIYYDKNSTLENLEIDSLNKISGKLTRLINKIQRLEISTWVRY